jgi:valyl-tRNA synthetase
MVREYEWAIKRLARVESLNVSPELPATGLAAKAVLAEVELSIPLEGVIDLEKEKTRLTNEVTRLQKQLTGLLAALNAPDFASKAPEHIVAEKNAQREELETKLAKLNEVLAMMN